MMIDKTPPSNQPPTIRMADLPIGETGIITDNSTYDGMVILRCYGNVYVGIKDSNVTFDRGAAGLYMVRPCDVEYIVIPK